jgi:hypothetical protein
MKKRKKKNRCCVCGKICGEKDYFELCRKHQKAWRIGFEAGKSWFKQSVLEAIKE